MVGAKRRARRQEMSRQSGPSSTDDQSNVSSSHESANTDTTKSAISAIYDGPKDTSAAPARVAVFRHLEGLGLGIWSAVNKVNISTTLPIRPSLNKTGRDTEIGLNSFNVLALPSAPVYQYDITIIKVNNRPGISNVPTNRNVLNKIWKSKALKQVINKDGEGNWIYDNNKLAWATSKVPSATIDVNLDAEEGRKQPSPKADYKVRVSFTKKLDFSMLSAYLNQSVQFSDTLLETISFLDHLMRQRPAERYTQIKKSFFARGETRFPLGSGVEAFKGVFASLRMAAVEWKKPGMTVNVDVANGTFFTCMDLLDSAKEVCHASSVDQFITMFQKSKDNWHKSMMYKYSKAFTHIGVEKKYAPGRGFKIQRFLNKDAWEYTFEVEQKNADGSPKMGPDGKPVKIKKSVAQYFQEHYKLPVRRGYPVIELTKKDVVPIEALRLLPNQRYRIKLDEKQTSQMIRFAVTLPNERWAAVQHGIGMLDWANDPYLRAYGLKISPQRTTVKGKLLPVPEPTFSGSKVTQRDASQGRWRIDGKKFLLTNQGRVLKSWGVAVVDSGRGPCVNQNQATNFFTQFQKIYRGHGGHFEGDGPVIKVVKTAMAGEMISAIWNETGNKYKLKPAILFFIVPTKDAETYRRIKKSCECRYGVVSQVLQSSHVAKAQDQYISNVCMKVNAKLGGATCVAKGAVLPKIAPNFGKLPTMIIGADVSHPAPGVDDLGSMAAFTMSLDREFTRYAAQCQTNGNRIEIITTHNIKTILKEMAVMWTNTYRGMVPSEVFYYRDGVSEGQYQFVLQQEVKDMKDMFKEINPSAHPKFTVVICAKRHHIRFFPKQGDRNGNPMPGTLVETGVTHPFEFDFYLNSHSAIKGTARPTHYHVIMNESGHGPDFLQQMTFEHCMQYARSTTPVSLFPAVYYAHLASNRAIAHKNAPQVSSGKKEEHEKKKAQEQGNTLSSSSNTPVDIPPLMGMVNTQSILGSMWYI